MALASTIVWEVRPAGSGAADTNGGGYKSDAGTTDYSIAADGPELTYTDGACAGDTTVTSANGGFTEQMVGNIIYLSTGPVWHEITACTDTNTITIDANGPTDTGMTYSVGGALATPGLASGLVVEGNWVYVKAGTYNLANTTAATSGGPIQLPANLYCGIEGYQTTRGDLGTKPILHYNTQSPTYGVYLQGGAVAHPQYVINLKVDGDATGSVALFGSSAATGNHAILCEAYDGDDEGFKAMKCHFCKSHDNARYGFEACIVTYCWADKNSLNGFNMSTNNSVPVNCLATNNTRDGFVLAPYSACINCTAYNNGWDGFGSAGYNQTYINCVAAENTFGYDTQAYDVLINCADYNNATSRVDTAPLADVGAVTLTGDPFDNAADPGGTYEPDATASQGADLRLAGVFMPGQIDSVNIGAIRHLVSAGGIVGAANKIGGRQA